MSVLKKIERDRLSGELASIEKLIASLTDEDVVTRFGLEERRDDIVEQLASIAGATDGAASVALFFGGKPVISSIGIEAEFGGSAVATFQDLIAKLMVQDSGLAQRGPVPNKGAATMHITNVVRGSFGFLMQEVQDQVPLLDTPLQTAVDHASKLVIALGSEDEQYFEEVASEVDPRALQTAGSFFTLLRQNAATFRLVAGGQDHAFGGNQIALAAARATSTHVDEGYESVDGQLAGTLPDGHVFEFRGSTGTLYTGKVDKSLSSDMLLNWNLQHLNAPATAEFRVRRVIKDGVTVRERFTLLSLNFGEGQVQLIEQS